MGVRFHWNTAITQVESGQLSSFDGLWRAERIFVCSGADFDVLYPREFREAGLVKCKLQMLRTATQPGGWRLGPSLCAGLTLRHYANFEHCHSLQAVSERYDRENPEFKKWGIHVLLSQNHQGELIIGDSHEYGPHATPFDNEDINQLILRYLHTFAEVPDFDIAETWHGVYPKLAGRSDFLLAPGPGVTIVNGLGGAGMTLSFGLAQEVLGA
ncbi:MAG: FAD-dependent oxidoreductase [Saprospiraceae bacterium]